MAHIAYYFFMSIALMCSMRFSGKEARFIILSVLLSLSIITEITVDNLKSFGKDHRLIYHVYIPIEYFLLALFFSKQNIIKHAKNAILISIPIFVLISLFISIFVIAPPQFPGLQFNIEGLFLIVVSLFILLTVELDSLKPFYQFSIFWICSGVILFHAGLFLFNGAYNYLLSNETREAKRLHILINTTLQYLLYLFWIIGFLCPQHKKNFTIRSL